MFNFLIEYARVITFVGSFLVLVGSIFLAIGESRQKQAELDYRTQQIKYQEELTKRADTNAELQKQLRVKTEEAVAIGKRAALIATDLHSFEVRFYLKPFEETDRKKMFGYYIDLEVKNDRNINLSEVRLLDEFITDKHHSGKREYAYYDENDNYIYFYKNADLPEIKNTQLQNSTIELRLLRECINLVTKIEIVVNGIPVLSKEINEFANKYFPGHDIQFNDKHYDWMRFGQELNNDNFLFPSRLNFVDL